MDSNYLNKMNILERKQPIIAKSLDKICKKPKGHLLQ